MSSPSTAKNELVLGLTASEAKILILGMVSTTDGKVSPLCDKALMTSPYL